MGKLATKADLRRDGFYPLAEADAKRWMRNAINNARAEYTDDCGEADLTALGQDCFNDLTRNDPMAEMEREHPVWDWAYEVGCKMRLGELRPE